MAITPLRSHSRSLSWPCVSNPAFSKFEETLAGVRGSETSCSSLSSINNRLIGLKSLYCNMGDLLHLPHTQQLISQGEQEKWADQVLDGHISLLDACTKAKDLVSQTKQNLQELLSALRRRDVDGIHCYLNSRRKSKKAIQKSLKDLIRSSKSTHDIIASMENGNETTILVHMLKDAELVTIGMLESLLAYLGGTNKAQSGGWSLVLSKLITSSRKNLSLYDQNEFEKIDGFFLQITRFEDVQVEMVTSQLKGMDSTIQDLEEDLDCLFRQLIRTRVFLLNLINH